RRVPKEKPLVLSRGKVEYRGTVEENEKLYENKRAYKILTIALEGGKTYQIEQVSQAYFSYLYLEDPTRSILGQHDSGGNGPPRILHRAEESGIYRIIANSQAGVRTGEFTLTVRVATDRGESPKVLPARFKELDKDNDGQVSLPEWLAGGR